MTERMFFAYEMNFGGKWCPVVYHGDKPSKKMEGEPSRSAVHEVPSDCIDEFGNPIFGKLQRMFPPPQEKEDSDG